MFLFAAIEYFVYGRQMRGLDVYKRQEYKKEVRFLPQHVNQQVEQSDNQANQGPQVDNSVELFFHHR